MVASSMRYVETFMKLFVKISSVTQAKEKTERMFNSKELSNMEENINIAAILKDKKNGIRLYSPIFGECEFCCVREDTNDICVKKHNGVKEFFDSKGLYYNTGEVMLFPSKSMRD